MIWAIDQDDDALTMLDIIAKADLCKNTDPARCQCYNTFYDGNLRLSITS